MGNFKHVREEALREVTEIFDSDFYILGPKVQAFEDAFAKYCGCMHVLGMSSGTDANPTARMTLGIGPGDEVIVPTFTFFAPAGCVARVGATPVFCDIDPASYKIDAAQFESLITPRTKAVIPVSLYGRIAGMNDLMAIARKRGVRVIEDACRSIEARDSKSSRMAGTIDDFGSTSFYPRKKLGAAGCGAAFPNPERERVGSRAANCGQMPMVYNPSVDLGGKPCAKFGQCRAGWA